MNFLIILLIAILIMYLIFKFFNTYPNPLYYETYSANNKRNKFDSGYY